MREMSKWRALKYRTGRYDFLRKRLAPPPVPAGGVKSFSAKTICLRPHGLEVNLTRNHFGCASALFAALTKDGYWVTPSFEFPETFVAITQFQHDAAPSGTLLGEAWFE